MSNRSYKKRKEIQKILFTCLGCGKKEYLLPGIAKRRKYCSKKCFYLNADHSGKNNSNYKGKKIKRKNRWYIWINGERIRQSRYIAEQYLGRKLKTGNGIGPTGEIVHHINGNKLDDRPENLYIFPSQSAHVRHHNMKELPTLTSNLT